MICRLLFGIDTEMCGELGIRTPGPFNKSTVFKTAAIDRSANSPGTKVQIRAELTNLILSFFNKEYFAGNLLYYSFLIAAFARFFGPETVKAFFYHFYVPFGKV